MSKSDWTSGYTFWEIEQACQLPPTTPWIKRMHRNPKARGTYWVRLSDGSERLMTYGTSQKWDAGRERLYGDRRPQVTHWKAIPAPSLIGLDTL